MEKIGNILQDYFKALGIEKSVRRYDALNIWSDVVGSRIAEVTKPVRISDRKIIVKVKNDTWRYEISYYKLIIVNKLNKELGEETIEDIILI